MSQPAIVAVVAALVLGAGVGARLSHPHPTSDPVVHVVVDSPVDAPPSDLELLLVCPLDLCPMDTP